MAEAGRAAVVILAGGEATRLPGKLAAPAGGVPLLVRVYRNVSAGRATVLAAKEPLPEALAAQIPAPVVLDRWPSRGPLAGLLSAMNGLPAPWVFAAAGDAPFLDAAFIASLEARVGKGDEAVVPRRMREGASRAEPLAALYAREAFLREGLPVLLAGSGAVRDVLDRLRTRYVDVADDRIFTNVNTPADYAAVRHALT